MKITLVIVTSLNGKITRWNNPNIYNWTSKEDTKHFKHLLQTFSLILMGRKTYEHARTQMVHIPGRVRVVFTKKPKKFQKDTIADRLEFTKETPQEVIKRFKKLGYKKALLVGGATLATKLLEEKLVDEIIMTIEPKLFGGKELLIAEKELDITLKLQSIEKLNSNGTLLLRYKVIK